MQPITKQPLQALIEQETATEIQQSKPNYDDCFHTIETLRQQIRASQGDKLTAPDVVEILRDTRNSEDE